MTKTQLRKALAAAGIVPVSLTGAGERWELTLENDKTHRAVTRKIGRFPGYRTGWGGWVLRPDYQSRGDWNDKSSAHHY